MDKTIVICGPTSTGKTSLALKLCHAFNGEIISADSRQIYKYMDLGTGKLPVNNLNSQIEKFDGMWKLSKIPVYMYDVVPPSRAYSVYDYSKKALNELISIQKRKKTPFIVGGTGFYIDVLTKRAIISNVSPNIKLRISLEKKSLEELQNILKTIDAKRYMAVDKKNKVRLIRAIEVCKGKKKSAGLAFPTIDTLIIGLSAPRTYLYKRADWWADKVVERGLILETKKLIDMGFRDSNPLRGIVYSPAVEYLDEIITLDEMREKVKNGLHGYIRRQLTWFNRNPKIKWFNIAEKSFDIKVLKSIQLFLDGN